MEGCMHGTHITDELSLKTVVEFLSRTWKMMLIFAVVAACATVYYHVNYPAFKAKAIMMIQKSSNSPLQAVSAKLAGMDILENRSEENFEKYILYLSSQAFYRKVAISLKERPDYPDIWNYLNLDKKSLRQKINEWRSGVIIDTSDPEVANEQMANTLAKATSVEQNGPDSLKVQVVTGSKITSVILANAIVDLAIQDLADRDLKELEDAKSFITTQIKEIEARIKLTNRSIMDLKKRTKFYSAQRLQDNQEQQLSKMKSEVSELEIAYEHNRKLMDIVKNEIQNAGEKDQMEQRYSSNNKLRRLERENEFYTTKMTAIKKIIDEFSKTQNSTLEVEQVVQSLTSKNELETMFYSELKKELLRLDVQHISLKNKITGLSRATMAGTQQSSTLPSKLLISIILSVLFAGFVSYLLEIINPTIKSRNDLLVYNYTLLGVVPDLSKKDFRSVLRSFAERRHKYSIQPGRKSGKRASVSDIRPIMLLKPDSPEAVPFKYLRAKILNTKSNAGERAKVISVMSAHRMEGKTMVCANLAASLAQVNVRTILVDCDMRNPALSDWFGIPNKEGLSTFLTANSTQSDLPMVKRINPRLDLLPAGQYREDVTEMLSSDLFVDLIKALRHYYDYILLDTPPVVPVADATAIASVSDLVVMTVSHRKTKLNQIEKAIENLRCINDTPTAFVLNRYGRFSANKYYNEYRGGSVPPDQYKQVLRRVA